MPTLTITVTTAQATRIGEALASRYIGTDLETAPLADQASDFIMSTVREMVRTYEQGEAVSEAIQNIQEL